MSSLPFTVRQFSDQESLRGVHNEQVLHGILFGPAETEAKAEGEQDMRAVREGVEDAQDLPEAPQSAHARHYLGGGGGSEGAVRVL